MTEGIEPQEEINEILDPVLDETPEQELEPELVEGEPVEAEEVPAINVDSPEYLAGQDAMKAQMQSALDRRIGKEVSKRKAFEAKVNARFMAQDKAAVEALPTPKIDDFLNEPNPDAAFYAAMQERDKALKSVQAPPAQQAQAQPVELSAKAQAYEALEAEYVANNPTYLPLVQNAMKHMNEDLRSALYKTDPATVHKLAGNLDKIKELVTMDPSDMGYEIAAFEIESKKGQPLPRRAQAKPTPTATKRGSNTSNGKDISEMSQSEYNAYMAKF